MIIYLVNSIDEDKLEINDRIPGYDINIQDEYILNFTDGSQTFQAFKELYFLSKNVYVYTSNLEYFLFKIRQFKYTRIVKVTEKDEGENRINKYTQLESKIIKLFKSAVKKKNDFEVEKKDGVEITFNPKIYSSISSSLVDPSLYFSKENTSSLIFKEIKKIRYA